MGFVPSSTTITATAYLTDRGREYLFNKNNVRFQGNTDLFLVQTFTLSDQDTNYLTGARLESGDIPDVTGENEGCLKSASNLEQQSLIFYDIDGVTPSGDDNTTEDPKYVATVKNGTTLSDGTVRDTILISDITINE